MKSMKLFLAVCIASFCVVLLACGGGSSGSAPSTRPTPTLTTVTVSPATATFSAGLTQQFTATAKYSDGTTKDVTSSVNWSSSATNIATVNASGLAKGLASGTATISAASGNKTGSATATVNPPDLLSVTLAPNAHSAPLGRPVQFTAVATYSDNSTASYSSGVTWSSSDATIATVDANGLVSSHAEGSVTITGVYGGKTAATAFTITAPVLNTVLVTPATATAAIGQQVQYSAYAVWTHGATRDVTSVAEWSSSSAAATVAAGLARGAAQGQANITAVFEGISGSAPLTVTAEVITALDITPDSPTVNVGGETQMYATATFSNGEAQDVSNVVWSVSDPLVASVSATGVVKGLVPGTATVTGTVGAFSDSTVVTVAPAALISITLAPGDTTLAKGTAQQFTATGTFSDGSTQTLTDAAWSSSAEAIATVNAGLVTAVAEGTTTITATSAGISQSVNVTVTAATLASVAVTPATAEAAIGTQVQFHAIGTFSDGTTQDITANVIWTSSDGTVALVDAAGLATAISNGAVTVAAVTGDKAGTAQLTVTPARAVTVEIRPDGAVMPMRSKMQLKLWVRFTNGAEGYVTGGVVWSSNTPRVASIGSNGVVRSKGKNGTTTIRATFDGITDTMSLRVSNQQITSLRIEPGTATIDAGGTQQFNAIGIFPDGTEVDITPGVRWSSTNPAAALVDVLGLATGVLPGTTEIRATFAGVTGAATLTVE